VLGVIFKYHQIVFSIDVFMVFEINTHEILLDIVITKIIDILMSTKLVIIVIIDIYAWLNIFYEIVVKVELLDLRMVHIIGQLRVHKQRFNQRVSASNFDTVVFIFNSLLMFLIDRMVLFHFLNSLCN